MKVNYVNEKELKKNKFKLRKIAVSLALASTILLAGCIKDKDLEKIKNKYNVENVDEFDISERMIIAKLSDYEKAYNDFQSDKSDIEKRMVLISETKKLSDIANTLISDKINLAMGTDYVITIENVDNNRIVFADDQNLGIKIPGVLNELMNNKDFIDSNIYKGDGSSKEWDREINAFNNNGIALYETILKHLDKNYELDGNKLKVVENEESKKSY